MPLVKEKIIAIKMYNTIFIIYILIPLVQTLAEYDNSEEKKEYNLTQRILDDPRVTRTYPDTMQSTTTETVIGELQLGSLIIRP